ncbi:MAG: type 2 periplasmic-binding domain-containing protein [Nitrospiria bacterium]
MKKLSIKSILLAGFLICSASFAHAQAVPDCAPPGGMLTGSTTTCVNMGGSSAVTAFATQIPLDMFVPNSPTTPVTHYVNGATLSPAIAAGKLHVWTGTLNATYAGVSGPGIIRYTATGSVDGYGRLDCQSTANVPALNSQNSALPYYSTTGYCGGGQPANIGTYIPVSNVDSQMYYLDYTNPAGCVAPVTITGNSVSGPVTYTEYTGCTGLVQLPVYLGAADVDGSSFHQIGPLGNAVKPLDETALTVTQVAEFPFQFVVGSSVTYAGGTTPNLTREEVVALLSNQVANWNLLPGYGATNSQPTLCPRKAGSGTKATLQVTQMKDNFNEAISGANVIFGASTQDVINCVNTHPYSIGYIDADQTVNLTGGARAATLDGLAPNEPAATHPKRNIQNGLYTYWVGERFNYRNAPGGISVDPAITSNQQSVMNAIVTDAQDPVIYPFLPAGAYWVPPTQMCVTKNDPGPIKWTNPAPAFCPVP